MSRMRGWMYTMILLGLALVMPIIWHLHGYRIEAITPVDYGLIAIVTLAAMMIALRIIYHPLNARLEPLLSTLPRTDQKVSFADAHRLIFKHTTAAQFRKRAWFELGFAALCWSDILLNYRYDSRSTVKWWLYIELGIAILSTVLAAVEFWLARRKSQEEKS